jgi:hypothetical protein
MPNPETPNPDHLRQIVAIKKAIEHLQSQLNSITGEEPQAGGEIHAPFLNSAIITYVL